MSRLKLHDKLLKITTKVYYRPPSNQQGGVTMSYPCIVYSRRSRRDTFADNRRYNGRQAYQVTVIDTDPDSTIPDEVLKLEYSNWENEFTNDNLYHTILTVYI